MIGMQDRLQRFHIHVNQEIGLNWKAFQLAIVPEIAISLFFFFQKDSYYSPLERGYVPVKREALRFSLGLSLLVYSSSSTIEWIPLAKFPVERSDFGTEGSSVTLRSS